MIRQLTILFFLLFGFINSNAQIIGEDYIAIPNDNSQQFILKFLNDSTLKITTIPRHMMPFPKSKKISFLNSDTSILIIPNKNVTQDSIGLKVGGSSIFELFEKEIKLSKIKNGFIDNNSKLIYVLRGIYDKNPNFLLIIDGKEFSYSESDLIINGKLYKQRDYSKILRKKLKKYNSNNSILTILKGLNSYYKYGLRGVFGTFVLTKMK